MTERSSRFNNVFAVFITVYKPCTYVRRCCSTHMRRVLTTSVARRKSVWSFGGLWYCSAQCFYISSSLLRTFGADVKYQTSLSFSVRLISVHFPAYGVMVEVSVHCNTFGQLHHHRCTVVQVCIKIPTKLLGEMSFELLCSLTQCAVDTRPAGKLEEVL